MPPKIGTISTPIKLSNPVKDPEPVNNNHSVSKKAATVGLTPKTKLPYSLDGSRRKSRQMPEVRDGCDASVPEGESSSSPRASQTCAEPWRARLVARRAS